MAVDPNAKTQKMEVNTNEVCPFCHGQNTEQLNSRLLHTWSVARGSGNIRIYDCKCLGCGEQFQVRYNA
jgi:hypothetical protein